jgi:hypothetical protein
MTDRTKRKLNDGLKVVVNQQWCGCCVIDFLRLEGSVANNADSKKPLVKSEEIATVDLMLHVMLLSEYASYLAKRSEYSLHSALITHIY